MDYRLSLALTNKEPPSRQGQIDTRARPARLRVRVDESGLALDLVGLSSEGATADRPTLDNTGSLGGLQRDGGIVPPTTNGIWLQFHVDLGQEITMQEVGAPADDDTQKQQTVTIANCPRPKGLVVSFLSRSLRKCQKSPLIDGGGYPWTTRDGSMRNGHLDEVSAWDSADLSLPRDRSDRSPLAHALIERHGLDFHPQCKALARGNELFKVTFGKPPSIALRQMTDRRKRYIRPASRRGTRLPSRNHAYPITLAKRTV